MKGELIGLNDYYFLRGGGEMGQLIRETDWSSTSIGHPKDWPQSLRTIIAMMLENPFGMYVAWGNDYIQLYNDGYRPILGTTKHPKALGISTKETFEEIWHIIGPMFDGVMQGKPVGFPDFMLPLNRNGFVEECYFDFSYSPIRKDDGEVGGVLVTVIETTNKKKSETALKESEIRFKTMAEASDVLIAISDATTNATYFNKAWTELTGRSMENLINFGWADLLHEDDKEKFVAVYLNAFEKYENWKGEFRILDKNGDYRWVLAKGVAIFTEDKTFTGYISSSLDITEQIRALEKVQENEINLRNLILQSPIGICVLDAATLICEIANDSFIEVSSQPHEALVGKHFWEPFKEARMYYEDELKKVAEKGTSFQANEVDLLLFRKGKQEHVYVTFVYTPLKDAEGNVKKVAVWVLENTKQVLSRQKVEMIEQRTRSLIESAPFPIGVYVGKEMIIEFANQSIIDIWGKGSDVIGKKYSDVLPELDNQEIFNQLDQVFTTGIALHITNQYLELVVEGKRKQYFFNYSFTPLFDLSGNVYGVMNTAADVTELNIAKLEVEQSEKNFRNIVAQSPVAMCILLGPSHIIEVANESMIELWGKGSENLLGKPIFEALPDARNQGLEELMGNVYKNGETFRAHEMPVDLIRNGKKEKVYQDFVYEPYRDSDGTILGVLAISRDVTEQALARKKIELAEEKARLAINSADLGVYEIDFENNIVFSDKRFREIFDLPGIVSSDDLVNLIHPEDRLGLQKAYSESLKVKQLDFQARILRSDQVVRWIRLTGKVITDNNINKEKLVGVGQDITEAVNARKKIEDSEKTIRNMIIQAPVAMSILRGPSMVVEIANSKMFELWGKREDELLNKPIFQGLPEAREQGFESLLQNVLTTGESFVANERPVNLPRNGKIETRYLNFVYQAYKANEDTLPGIIAVAIDVTEQVLARQKIEEVVTHRTKDLADANDNLQRSNAELAQFAYIASHDLQEPLRKISTYSQMLESVLGRSLDENSKKYINKINNSSQRMNNLIRDVLNYSELSRENELFSMVDLNQVVENIKTDFELLIEQKNAVIECDHLPVIMAIPLQMSQLFSNMISNALKFARQDVSPLLKITAKKISKAEIKELSLDKGLSYYRIRFSDNGIGVHPDYIEQIFNIFQRLHRKSEFEGTGIGLALCKKIALNHHGLLNASGSSENGAVFNLILPLTQSINDSTENNDLVKTENQITVEKQKLG